MDYNIFRLPVRPRLLFGLGILFLVIVGIGLAWYYMAQQQKLSWPEKTAQECTTSGGRVVNTLNRPKEFSNRDVIGVVTGLLCPCVCVKE